eukprot:c26101_g1_i1.p1 GENE.c26101_g1_i1~~c26101_g1_i1.p1  ORF type:complete len:366 (-),score=109.51 c26101_g1_i1:126-1223(-)
MSKGNQLPELVMLRTRIPDIDDFFNKAADPLKQIVDWNNNLDSMLQVFRSMGSDIKGAKIKDKKVIGVSEIKLSADALSLTVVITKDGAVVPAAKLDKLTKQYVTMIETKAKLLNKRVNTLKKKPNLDHVKFKLEESEVKLDIDKKWEKEYTEDDALIDMRRSICKFNDRYNLLVEQLKGPVTIQETVVALFEDVKAKIKELGSEIKVKIGKDLVPELVGIPHNIQEALPSLPARGWQLYSELMDYIKGMNSQVPDLEQKLQTLGNEAKQLQSTIKDAATSAGLSMAEGFKALKAFKRNLDSLVGGPKMLNQLVVTLRQTLMSVGSALTGKADTAAPTEAATATTTAESKDAASSGDGDADGGKD